MEAGQKYNKKSPEETNQRKSPGPVGGHLATIMTAMVLPQVPRDDQRFLYKTRRGYGFYSFEYFLRLGTRMLAAQPQTKNNIWSRLRLFVCPFCHC